VNKIKNAKKHEFCLNHGKHTKGHGYCIKKPEGFCRDNTQCEIGYVCSEPSNSAHGKCKNINDLPKPNHLHHFNTVKGAPIVVPNPSDKAAM